MGFDERDDIGFAHVAHGAEGVGRGRIGLGAVFLDAEQAIVLEQGADAGEIVVEIAIGPHVVDLAHDHHAVDGALALGGNGIEGIGGDARFGDSGPACGLGREGSRKGGEPITRFARGGGNAGGDADVGALVTQIGDEDARVPAAGRHVVRHGHARLDAEEGQRFSRMAEGIAGAVLVAAGIGESHCHRRIGGAGSRCGRIRRSMKCRREGGCGGKQDGREDSGFAHDVTPMAIRANLPLA